MIRGEFGRVEVVVVIDYWKPLHILMVEPLCKRAFQQEIAIYKIYFH
jgi:hypothetical protein